MTTEQLREFHETRPFRPFRIHLADGKTLSVRHPEILWRPPNARTFAVWTGDAISVIDLLLVTRLEALGPRNGSRRSR
jgi:hypothetical protein